MFERLKRVLGSQKKAPSDGDKQSSLAEGPVTAILIREAARLLAEGESELREEAGYKPKPREPGALRESASTAAAIMAFQITSVAAKAATMEFPFLPGDNVPKAAPMIVAYSLFVLLGIQHDLQEEGVELDFRDVASRTANLFFIFHSDSEKEHHMGQGLEAFRTIAHSDATNVKGWHDNLMTMVHLYLSSLAPDSRKLPEQQAAEVFGKLLTAIVQTLE